MQPETVFSLASMMAMAGWLVLIVGIALKRPLLRDTVAGLAIPLLLAAAYAILIALFFWRAEGGFGTLANVQKLFTAPWAALAGWVHYLAFDLAIGAWLSRQIMERGLNRLLLIPILPLTFLFGPIGFLLGQAILIATKDRAS